jgi:SAM-dependent methyltransferase
MPKFHNRTRTSHSIPRKLFREGKFHLIPLYYIMQTSDLAREAIEHSGSYRFADHVYRNQPSGRFLFGTVLDAILLRLPSSKSMRMRYVYAKKEIHALISQGGLKDEDSTLDILAVPCGLGRELFEVADELIQMQHPRLKRVRFFGLDLDDDLVAKMNKRSETFSIPITFFAGDALEASDYPATYDMIFSTGLTEFLSDDIVERFYRVVLSNLKPGGVFVTSGMLPHALSAYLMRNIAELHASYRGENDLRSLAKTAGFSSISTYKDPVRLQTMMIARA